MRRVLLLVATIILCVGLGSCQMMTEEEIQAAYDEAFAAGAASVDVTSLLEDAEKSEDLERQLEANRTEGYAEGFDRGYKAGYENGRKVERKQKRNATITRIAGRLDPIGLIVRPGLLVLPILPAPVPVSPIQELRCMSQTRAANTTDMGASI